MDNPLTQEISFDSGRVFVVGDIHGCLNHLRKGLREVLFDYEADHLVAVGDLVDRGVNSLECMMLVGNQWFHSVAGNHELMAVEWFERGRFDREITQWYSGNGGQWFINLPTEQQEYVIRTIKRLPLRLTVTTPSGSRYGIIHADYISKKDWNHPYTKHRDDWVWGRSRIKKPEEEFPEVSGVQMVYCGHTPVREVVQKRNVRFIDTGAVYGGPLTIEEIK